MKTNTRQWIGVALLLATVGLMHNAVDANAHRSTLAPESLFSSTGPVQTEDKTTIRNPSKAFLGFRSMGLFAPLSYWRSDRDWGIGDLDTFLQVIDFAKKTHLSIVQILPPNTPIAENSPYSNASTYVFDPVYIGMDGLFSLLRVGEGEIPQGYAEAATQVPAAKAEIEELRRAEKSQNDRIRALKYKIFRPLFEGFKEKELEGKSESIADYLLGEKDSINTDSGSDLARGFKAYCAENRSWLSDHLLFFSLMKQYQTDDFRKWPSEVAMRYPEEISRLKAEHSQEILFEAFVQWIWKEQFDRANKMAFEGDQTVDIMLDQPFAFGNADVWINLDAFVINPITLKRDFTQGAPPHRLDVPQHWQFYLLDTSRASAKQLLVDRLRYYLRFCSVLRIDHLLGYYRLYNLSEDPGWNMTLESLGIWPQIQDIYQSPLEPKEKRTKIYEIIVAALQKKLPADVRARLFSDTCTLRHANVILAARGDFQPGDYSKEQCGWYKQWSIEHNRDLLYTLVNPSEYGGIDYLQKIIQKQDMFLRPTDSIRVGYFSMGLGEGIVGPFMAAAQSEGKTLVFENLGVVPREVSQSLGQLGASQFCPLTFGYKFFIGDHNAYWFDQIGDRDYACFSLHDGVTVRGWWEGKGRPAQSKYYFRSDREKQAVIQWLQEHGYLGAATVDTEHLTDDFLRAVLMSVSDSTANMAVFMMPDIFGSGEEGIINMPGEIGWWTTRSPITTESLLAAATTPRSIRGDAPAEKAVSLIEDLAQAKDRDSLEKQIGQLDANKPHVLFTHPVTAANHKQLAVEGEDFLVDAVVFGDCKKAEVVFEDQTRHPMVKMQNVQGLPPHTALHRAIIHVNHALVGTTPFRVSLDGGIAADPGYLIGLATHVDANPLSDTYGHVKEPAAILSTRIFSEDFFANLSKPLGAWLKRQRWFLEKTAEIQEIRILDYFEMTETMDVPKSFGVLARVTTRLGEQAQTHVYFLPLNFFKELSQAGGSTDVTRLDDSGIYFGGAEHTLAYQKGLIRNLVLGGEIFTAKGNRVVSETASPAFREAFSRGKLSVRDLLAGVEQPTTNSLTSAVITKEDTGALKGVAVVKTFRRGGEEIEPAMYDALEDCPVVPTFLGQVYLQTREGWRTPLNLVVDRIRMPRGLQRWEALAGYNIWNAFVGALKSFASQNDGSQPEQIRRKVMSDVLQSLIYSKVSNEDLIRNVATVIAGFHATLAQNPKEGFGVQPAQASDLSTLQEDSVVNALDKIQAGAETLTDSISHLVAQYVAHEKGAIRQTTDRLLRSTSGLNLSRIHGDMQLEQIMFDDRFNLKILDLGGSPLETIAQKRQRKLALYDIAGIIRAFGYIKQAALKQILSVDNLTLYRWLLGNFQGIEQRESDISPEQIEAMVHFANDYEEMFRHLLVDAYFGYLQEKGATDLIVDAWKREMAEDLLHFCVVARALHELEYELSARPQEGMALIPLEGIQSELFRVRMEEVQHPRSSGSGQLDDSDATDQLILDPAA